MITLTSDLSILLLHISTLSTMRNNNFMCTYILLWRVMRNDHTDFRPNYTAAAYINPFYHAQYQLRAHLYSSMENNEE